MTIETINMQDVFREYDGLVGLTMLNIYTLSKDIRTIRLIDFDRKNKEHLYMLRVALMARDIYQLPIEIEGSWWDIFCLNRKIRKNFKRVKRYKHLDEEVSQKNGVCVPEVLNLMRPDGIMRLSENFTFADIYEEYYEGSLN